MAITSLTVVNPGAETGDVTGWTMYSGAAPLLQGPGTPNSVAAHSGSYYFAGAASAAASVWGQAVDVSAFSAAIDAGTAAVKLTAYHTGFTDADTGALGLTAYAVDGTTLLDSSLAAQSDPSTWTLQNQYLALPVNTRFVRLYTSNVRVAGTQLSAYWDDFTLEISTDKFTDFPNQFNIQASQLGVYSLGAGETDESLIVYTRQMGTYVLASHPAEEVLDSQFGTYGLAASETSTGLYLVQNYQLGAYALCRGLPRRSLRAYTFTQDDHDFYGLNLGNDDLTLIYDKLSQQWSQWRSPGYNNWRVADAVAWEGYNLGADPLSGKIWQIDPTGRLDYETTPITSQVVGGLTERFRTMVPCFMAELALSEGQPPAGVDAGEVTIQLRTSDGLEWVDHGTVLSQGIGDEITVRWYGLGLMKAPGQLFELTDTGYARRIDGLNIEVGGNADKP